jgi:acylphosphatase
LKARAHAWIEGEVQGVGFRASAWNVARRLEVTGWVRNVVDGRVETVVEGEKDKVERMVEWYNRGPPGAYVTNIEVEWLPYKGEFTSFEIKRSGYS